MTVLIDSLEALSYLLGGAVVTYLVVGMTQRQNAQGRRKRGNR